MRIAHTFIIALLGIQPLIAELPTVESLALKVEILEEKVAVLSAQVALSSLLEQPPRDGAIVIYVRVDGNIEVDGEIVSDAEVARKLQAVSAQVLDQPLQIRASNETKYQDIVRVIDLCRKAGISNISFATEKTPDEQGGSEQPIPRLESKPDGSQKSQPEAEDRSR